MKQSNTGTVYPRMTILLRALLVALLCATAIAASLAGGCNGQFGQNTVRGSRTVATESRDVAGFSQVHQAGGGDVVIEHGGSDSLVVEAEDNILPMLETTVRDGVLYLGARRGASIQTTRPILYRVRVRSLTGVSVSGSGNLRATGIDADRFTSDISGSGRADLAGRGENLAVRVSGSGSVNASRVQSKTARVTISGSGGVVVNASDHVDATISGSGSVRYVGKPRVQQRVSGSGIVVQW